MTPKYYLPILLVLALLATGGASAATTTVTTFSETVGSYTTYFTQTIYYATDFTVPPETTTITQTDGTPVKNAVVIYTNRAWVEGHYTYTVQVNVTTKKIVIVFRYRSFTSLTTITYTQTTYTTTASYTTSTVTSLPRTGTATVAKYLVATGSIVDQSRTTIFTSTTYVVESWSADVTIILHTASSTYSEAKTMTVFIPNSYGLSYETTATIIEIITRITSESPVPYEVVKDITTAGTDTLINYTDQRISNTTLYTTIITIIEDGRTYSLTAPGAESLTELTNTTYQKTIASTTITTNFTGTLDANAEVVLDGYVDSKYYSTSTITLEYHDVNYFVTPEETTTAPSACYLEIRWTILIYARGELLQLWFNELYVEIRF